MINKKKMLFLVFYYLPVRLAVIAIQYTIPGAKPTISGIQTGHPTTGFAMLNYRE